jgi:type II secretory pathway pseudopilin PulG
MKTKNFFKSVSGFSIVEVVVAMGLLGGVSLGFIRLMDNANKASKTIEVKDDILQMERQIADVLNSQNNCEATLFEKTINNDVPIIYQVVNNEPIAKLTVSSVTSKQIQISSMKIKNVDQNGSDGSTALATLEVVFKKPSTTYGAQDITKQIILNANLCQKKWIQHTDLKELLKLCIGGKIIDGPNTWGATYWASCQDCSMANAKTIYSCQARGGSGGIDATNMAKISCYNIGGTFDDVTSTCSLRDKIAEDSCYAIGGVLDTSDGSCKFDMPKKNLLEYINSLVDKKLPDCVIMAECRAPYSNQGNSFGVTTPTANPYNEYARKCTAGYTRVWEKNWLGVPTAKSVLCAGNYNQYGTTSQSCLLTSRNANATCSLPDWINSCSGCGSGCFQKTSYSCSTTSTVSKTEPGVTAAKVYTCCR